MSGITLSLSVGIRADTELCSRPFVDRWSGEPFGSLDVGGRGAGLWGSPEALRRLAYEVVAAAEDAEQLVRAAPRDAAVMGGATGDW